MVRGRVKFSPDFLHVVGVGSEIFYFWVRVLRASVVNYGMRFCLLLNGFPNV